MAVATNPGVVPEMETADKSDSEYDILESRTVASVHGTEIHYANIAEGGCCSPTAGVFIREGTTISVM